MASLVPSRYKWGVIGAKEYLYTGNLATHMSGTDDEEKGLRGEAKKQIASVVIPGSSIETKPGLDPEELNDSE